MTVDNTIGAINQKESRHRTNNHNSFVSPLGSVCEAVIGGLGLSVDDERAIAWFNTVKPRCATLPFHVGFRT